MDNPSKMRELAQKVIKAMEKVETQGIKQTYELKKDAEKYGKNSSDVVTAKTELEDPNAAAFMERFMSMLFGPEGMTTRSVYLKDKVVQTVGGGKQAMTDALAAQEQKSATTKTPFQTARGKLAPKSNVVVMFDLANTAVKILELVAQAQVLPLPLDADQIKQLQSKPSYFGLSAGTEAQGLRVKTVVPVEQMQGFAKIGMFFQQQFGGAGQ
ncbi:MAG: hypothetical protein HY290_20490 [Planctomycetia bacterium]|nr:hypothetical protein [Planctomycetia bacterium]